MRRDRRIVFRVNEKEYKEINEKKSKFETLSEYIRRILLS